MRADLKKKIEIYAAGSAEVTALWEKDPASHIENQLCVDAERGVFLGFEKRLRGLIEYAIQLGYRCGFADGECADTPTGVRVLMTLPMANAIAEFREARYRFHREAAPKGTDIVVAVEREVAQFTMDRLAVALECTPVKVV